ncbi:MAG: DUF1786 family protein [Candidatus Rifleibacteriota bacterium]
MKSINKAANSLLIDIGTGTRDIMLFTDSNCLENNSKIVAPTATRNLAQQIAKENRDLKIAGYTMGGGALSSSLKKHLNKGFSIEIEPEAGFTVRNNLKQLEKIGFSIKNKIESPDIIFDDIELNKLLDIFTGLGHDIKKFDLVGIAVQDHGDHEYNESSRKKRFDYFNILLSKNNHLSSLVFLKNNLPEFFTRMKSAARNLSNYNEIIKNSVFMDTCVAAIAGCWYDKNVRDFDGPVLYVNFGNGHTLACVMENQKILSFYEHHTSLLKNKSDFLSSHLIKLVEGELSFEEVFDDGGHGCRTFEAIKFSDIAGIVVTGPQRNLADKLGMKNFYEASPGGDMMMTGPLGLMRGYNQLQELK